MALSCSQVRPQWRIEEGGVNGTGDWMMDVFVDHKCSSSAGKRRKRETVESIAVG